MTGIIVDDNEMSRVALQKLCGNIEALEILEHFEHAGDALRFLKDNEVDLLLLDIEMPDITGLDMVRSLEHLPMIIFITSKKEYAVEAFELKDWVVDYLTKPLRLPRLQQAINRAHQWMEDANPIQVKDYIFVRSSGKLARIDLNELEYIETVGDYIRFQTTGKAYLVHGTVKSVEKRLQHPDLLKVNRSYIVNLAKIKDIEDNTILIGKKVIPVSRAHRPILLKRINPL